MSRIHTIIDEVDGRTWPYTLDAEPAPILGLSSQASMRAVSAARKEMREHDLAWRYEIDTSQTFAPNTSTPIRFTNENIYGEGAKFESPIWTFRPPPNRLGAYQVSAFINYFSGLAQNLQTARLEVWVKRWGFDWKRWSVLDAAYANGGAPDAYDYLARVALGGVDVIYLDCNDLMQFRAYHAMAAPLMLAIDSIYGYCSGHWLGCPPSPTDLAVQNYLIPDA